MRDTATNTTPSGRGKRKSPEGDGKKQSFVQKLFSPIVLGNMGGIITVLLVLWFGSQMWLSCVTNHGETATVPDVIGLNVDSARARLLEAGLGEPLIDSVYVRGVAAGQVVDQSPRAGREAPRLVKRGRVPQLTVSKNEVPCRPLPDVIENGSESMARNKLLQSGFTVTETEYITGAKDWVYGMRCMGRDVTGNELVPIDRPVTLVVGNGESDEAVEEIANSLMEGGEANELVQQDADEL